MTVHFSFLIIFWKLNSGRATPNTMSSLADSFSLQCDILTWLPEPSSENLCHFISHGPYYNSFIKYLDQIMDTSFHFLAECCLVSPIRNRTCFPSDNFI